MVRQRTLSSERALYIPLFSCQEILLSSERNPVCVACNGGFDFGIRHTTVETGSP